MRPCALPSYSSYARRLRERSLGNREKILNKVRQRAYSALHTESLAAVEGGRVYEIAGQAASGLRPFVARASRSGHAEDMQRACRGQCATCCWGRRTPGSQLVHTPSVLSHRFIGSDLDESRAPPPTPEYTLSRWSGPLSGGRMVLDPSRQDPSSLAEPPRSFDVAGADSTCRYPTGESIGLGWGLWGGERERRAKAKGPYSFLPYYFLHAGGSSCSCVWDLPAISYPFPLLGRVCEQGRRGIQESAGPWSWPLVARICQSPVACKSLPV